MKTAEQMFEELEYKLTRNDDMFIEYQRDDGDQHAEIIFSLKGKTFKAIYGRYEFGMTYHDITLDELKAIICQAKELGWIEPEHQQETNLEHYKDEIKYAGYEFALVNGKPTMCKNLCDQCYFNDKRFTCARMRMEWMLETCKEKYKLT